MESGFAKTGRALGWWGLIPGLACVQDERYIAREHMDVRHDCVRFARHSFTCMGTEVARYLSPGLAVNTSM